MLSPFRKDDSANETCAERHITRILGDILRGIDLTRDNCSDSMACTGTPQPWALYVGATVTGSVALVGTILNFVALVLILHFMIERRKSNIRKVTAAKVFVLNLVVVDLLYCAVAMPFLFTTYVTRKEPPGCAVSAFIRYLLNFGEFSLLSIIAFNKCYGVLRTSSKTLFTLRQAIWCCVIYWIACASLQIAIAYKLGFGFNNCMYRCDILNMHIGRVLVFVLEGILPMMLLVLSYWMVLFRILHWRRHPVTCSSHEQRKVSRRTGRAVCSLVQHMYLITMLPVCLYNILDVYGQQRELGILSYCPLWLLFIINPITHVFSDKQTKSTIKSFYQKLQNKQGNKIEKTSNVATALYTVSLTRGHRSFRSTNREAKEDVNYV